jgi:hypothetical protein
MFLVDLFVFKFPVHIQVLENSPVVWGFVLYDQWYTSVVEFFGLALFSPRPQLSVPLSLLVSFSLLQTSILTFLFSPFTNVFS